MIDCTDQPFSMIGATASSTIRAGLPLLILCLSVLPKIIGLRLPVEDSFHLGEAFAAATTLIANAGSGSSPLTLHGAWDFIPALVSRALWGDANAFYPTLYLTTGLLPALSALLFLLFLCRLLQHRSGAAVTVFLSMAALAAPNLVGIRDLFLLIGCWSLFELLHAETRTSAIQAISLLVPATAIGVLWSLDRGMVGAAVVMTSLLTAAGLRRQRLFVNVLLLILAACAAAIWIGELSGSLSYATNLGFVIRTSHQWRYPLSAWVAANVALVATFTGCTLLVKRSGPSLWREPGCSPFWAGLAVCSLLMLRLGINRADLDHILPAMWPPLVLSAYATRQQPAPDGLGTAPMPWIALLSGAALVSFAASPIKAWTPVLIVGATSLFWSVCLAPERTEPCKPANAACPGRRVEPGILAGPRQRPRAYGLVPYALILVLFVLTALGPWQSWRMTLQGLGEVTLVTPLEFLQRGVPYSRVADSGQAWAAQRIRASGSDCILDMTNSGLINAGVGKPTCSRFAYPVYASKNDQTTLINELKASAPKAIVYSTTAWQYAIDGQAMPTRLPRVDRFLKRRYPRETCHQGLCIRRSQGLRP